MREPEKPQGTIVRDWLRDQILKQPVTLVTHKSRNKGKFWRWLCVVKIDGRDLNQKVIDNGMAKIYEV